MTAAKRQSKQLAKDRSNDIKLLHDSHCWRQKENGHIGQQEIPHHVDMPSSQPLEL